MLGAILGDIIGSPYEFDCSNRKTVEFPLFCARSKFTDDSVMTVAVLEGLMNCWLKGDLDEVQTKRDVVHSMRRFGSLYPDAGYGARFSKWLSDEEAGPYGSYGNGAAMRVSPVAWLFDDLEQVLQFARFSAEVTHDHPEGIKGAQAVAAAIFLARQCFSKREIKKYIQQKFQYDLDRTLDEIRPGYHRAESCQESVPEAILAFLEGHDFEDCVRKAVSLGGDSDTIAAITGSIAEGFYGIPQPLKETALKMLEEPLLAVIRRYRVYWNSRKAGEHQTFMRAFRFAEEKHREQTRIGGRNYISHPAAVAERLKAAGYPLPYQLAGLLHDCLEDTDATLEELKELCGEAAAHAVMLMTKEPGYQVEDYIGRILQDPIARAVKTADRIHNLECALEAPVEFRKGYAAETRTHYLKLDGETKFFGEIQLALERLEEGLSM